MLGFPPMICEFQGWAQGGLGMAILGAGLVFAIGLMVYLRWTGNIPYVIGGALLMYYGIPVIEDMFHWDQDCAVIRTQFAQQEQYAANTRVCENNLFNTEAQTGEDCSCNGESVTPDCESYYAACENQVSYTDTQTSQCSCAFSDQTQSASPYCSAIPNNARPPAQSSKGVACNRSNGGWDGVAQACADPQYQAAMSQSEWIAPTTNFYDGDINGAAFYSYQTEIDNPTGEPKTVYWYGESDNEGWYDLNGQQVGNDNNWAGVDEMPIVLQPGENKLTVTVQNFDQSSSAQNDYGANPSGTIDQIDGPNGTVYSSTGGDSWYQIPTVPPSALSPPPSGPTVNCYTQSCAATP
ncbi:hypothetical protein [Acidithiobacillus concretivorus]|uniref:Uncharacterized protein n=1 Tax=Acidithiobacillus concretivorus TaxID=3063952 RepID=A0ABS5ZQX8_9PROT|nr:hypothetical protein [Acidithiobacillus concretivorus]MBU2738573.1 hypothetical protein [Acidithiobacillus concretivorus]